MSATSGVRDEVQIAIPQRRLQTAIDEALYETTFFEERLDYALGYGLERNLHIHGHRLGKPEKRPLEDGSVVWRRETQKDKRGIHCAYERFMTDGRYDPNSMSNHEKIAESVRFVKDPLCIQLVKGRFFQTMSGFSDAQQMAQEIKYIPISYLDKRGAQITPQIRISAESSEPSLQIRFQKNEGAIALETEILFMYQILSRC